jgi:hypothetical protein
MPYKTRTARRLANKSKRNFITLFLIFCFLFYAIISWVFPAIINGAGFVSNFFRPVKTQEKSIADNATIAPPILSIPFEATNTAQIDIKGYATGATRVKIIIDGEIKDTVKVEGDDSFNSTGVSLNLGTNNIHALAIDILDKESLPSKSLSVVYDSEKPMLIINEPEDNKTFQGERRINVSGKTEADAFVYVNDSKVIVQSDGSFITSLSLNDGENTITIKSQDKASNTNEVRRSVTFNP